MEVKNGYLLISDISGYAELQGADVILANRLMKNHVKEATGLNDYGLISQAAVEATGAEALVAGMFEHQEGDPAELEPLFRGAAQDALRRLAAILEAAQPPG